MAISIHWGTKVITVPRADMTLLQTSPTEIRQLNLNSFRLELKDIEDSSDGMAFERTHLHNTSVEVGGVVLARVIEIINGYSITFEDGAYAVNLVGANSNVGDVVNVNQVSVRSANSAGLQDLSTLLSASYQGQVVIDIVHGQAGIDTPIGTFSTPVGNIPDALKIAEAHGLHKLLFLENTTVVDDLFDSHSEGYTLTGVSIYTELNFNEIANIQNCALNNLTIIGDLDGLNTISGCILKNVTDVSGHVTNSGFKGTVTLNGDLLLSKCYSNFHGLGYAQFNVGSSCLATRDYHGTIGLTNVIGEISTVEVDGGKVVLDSSCIGGKVILRGEPFEIIDNSNGTEVIDETDSVKTNAIHTYATKKLLRFTQYIGLK